MRRAWLRRRVRVYDLDKQPETEILGGPELFINKGSTINLTCVVKHSPDPPPTMTWSHNSEEINFDSPRGGISLVTEKGPETSSRLLIQRASATDSGEYTCDPTGAAAATVRVHILNGEHPAAMHHGHAPPCAPPPRLLLLATLGSFLLLRVR